MLLPDTQPPSCRVAEHDGTDAAGAMPASQTFWARTDEIRTKLEAGEIAVGAANRLQMQAWDDFRIAQGQAKSTVADEDDAGKLQRRRCCRTATDNRRRF